MEQATSSISVSQQGRPTRNADSNRTKRLFSKACFRPVDYRAHMLRIAHFDPEFAFRFNVSSFSCSVSLDRGRLPSHGLEWRVFSTHVHVATLLEVFSTILFDGCCASHDRSFVFHLPVRPERWLSGNTDPMRHGQYGSESIDAHLMIPYTPFLLGKKAPTRTRRSQEVGRPTKSSRTSFGVLKIVEHHLRKALVHRLV